MKGIREFIKGAVGVVVVAACTESNGPTPRIAPADLLVWKNAAVAGETTPVIDSSAVYHLQQGAHVVTALDRVTGVVKWRRTLPVNAGISGYGMALAGGVLVVGDMDVFGLDPADGHVVWTFAPTVGSYPGFGTLTADGSTVYCGSTTGHLYAVDAVTGQQKWVTSFSLSPTQVWDPVVRDGVVYAAFTVYSASQFFTPSGAAAFDASTGALVWKTMTPQLTPTENTANDEAVAVTASLVVLGSTHGLYGLDRLTGAVKIVVDGATFANGGPNEHVIKNAGNMIVVGSSFPGHVTGLDPTDLHLVWRDGGSGTINAISTDATHTYVARIGRFEVYRTSDGTLLWSLEGTDVGAPDELYLAAPGFDDSRIYLPGTKGVYAFKKE